MSWLLVWLAFSVICYGVTVAQFWYAFPQMQSQPGRLAEVRLRGVMFGVAGPVGLPVTLVLAWGFTGKAWYGWKW